MYKYFGIPGNKLRDIPSNQSDIHIFHYLRRDAQKRFAASSLPKWLPEMPWMACWNAKTVAETNLKSVELKLRCKFSLARRCWPSACAFFRLIWRRCVARAPLLICSQIFNYSSIWQMLSAVFIGYLCRFGNNFGAWFGCKISPRESQDSVERNKWWQQREKIPGNSIGNRNDAHRFAGQTFPQLQ